MSDPEKENLDRFKGQPTGAPDNKCLHPIFGTYTRTESYSALDAEGATTHIHCEAYLDDPVKKTWTVAKVVRRIQPSFNPLKVRTTTHVHKLKTKVNFREAVTELAAFEAKCKEKPAVFKTIFPEGPAMGFAHFKAFAEREGYVFDTKNVPHARPDAQALPANSNFYDEDIASANKNLQRPADEFDNNGPASKTPNTLFLLDHFTRAAHGSDYTASTAGMRVLNILDRFVDQIDKAHAKLTEYCGKYHELGHGGLITDAENLLTAAESSVNQMKAYGVDTKEFESFVLQCKISCYVLHAEGLYGLMNQGKGDFDANEELFKSRVNQAMEAYKQIDNSDDGMKTLKNMIVQMPEPKVPDAIGAFVERYKGARKNYETPKPESASKKKPPSPKP